MKQKIWKKLWITGSLLLLGICSTGCGQKEELLVFQTDVQGKPEETPSPVPVLTEEPKEPARIYVDVAGAVQQPGVYALNQGDRIFQAIEAAGGFREDAETSWVNQAGLVNDGEQILVPTKEEAAAGEMASQRVAIQASEESASLGKVNLNTADEAKLQTLTGIGQSKARAIIAYREANGPFGSIEEIKNVEGIKEGTFLKIKDDIVVG